MQNEGLTSQILRWTALGALFLIPLTPLIVANSFFFPFITGKAFFFRTVVEIAFCAWLALAVIHKEYRPRFSWIGAAAVAFVVWMFIADCFAPNAAKAFWSNFERMEGWILLVHLLGLFFAASNMLRVEKKWREWFLASLAVSIIISLHALLQLPIWMQCVDTVCKQASLLPIHQGSSRIDASLGNSAYLAIYFLFNVCIAGWLALTEHRAWLKWGLIVLAFCEGVLIFFTETRGTVLGLVGALFLGALLTALTGGKYARRFASGALLLLILLSGTFYLERNSNFVQDNSTLHRVASISLADGQTRFTIWNMAWKGVLASPVVGYGQEGFNYVFNKYYEPSLYGQEPWFDRAHNAFLDWFTAGGFPAFILYVSLFIVTLVALWRNSVLSRPERIALTAAFFGYACHNLFVFDNLYSYVYFFAILALVDSQISRPFAKLENLPPVKNDDAKTYVLPITIAVAIGLIWFVNVPGMEVATELITAISPSPAGFGPNIAAFQDLTQNPSFAAQEIREQLVAFAGTVASSQSATNEQKQQVVTLAVTEMQKQVAAYPNDARERLQLAFAYRSGGDVKDSYEQVLAASALSPNKEDILVQAAAAAWDAGDTKAVQEYFNKAYQLAPQSTDLGTDAAAGDYAVGDVKSGDALLMKLFGTTTVDNDVLALTYYRTKNWPRLIALWQLRLSKSSTSEQTWFSLASAYYVAGDKANAIAVITEAMKRFPDTAASGAAAIAEINAAK